MFEYICPVCGNSLQKSNAEYLCKNNHSYDISKQGYINLLMSSKSFHGDSKAMIMARHDFLKKGYYSHLLQKICHSVSSYAPQGGRILDMGCGEGYYTSELPSEFLSVGGIDISKDAISIAAKRKSGALFAVASASKLPVADNSVDIALSVFAPFYIDEIKRILKKSGVFMCVYPLEKHLWELKNAVYETPYENSSIQRDVEGFSVVEHIEIRKQILLEKTIDIVNLFSMTPYFFKTSKPDFEKLQALKTLETQTEFCISIYTAN